MKTTWPRNGGGTRDREELVRRYMPLARSLAARYRSSDEPSEDLVQVASIGLLKAIDRYDPGYGAAFSSFAVPTILGELRRHFRDHTWAVRVPRERQELYLRCERTRDELLAALGRNPTVADLAERLGASQEDVLQALELNAAYRPVSLDGEPGEEPGDGAVMPGAPDAGYDRAEDRALLATLVPGLSRREAEILHLRFHEDLTQAEIGRRVGVSQMQVSRVLHRCLRRLRVRAGAPADPDPGSALPR